MTAGLAFESLETLKKLVSSIRQSHERTMRHYVSDDKKGFYHQPRKRFAASRSSTATCVSSLVGAELWNSSFDLFDRTPQVVAQLLKRPWTSADLPKNNAFTLAFIAEGVLDLHRTKQKYRGRTEHKRLLKTIQGLLFEKIKTSGAIGILPYPESAYLTQLVFRVLKKLGMDDAEVEQKTYRWSRSEINKQLSLLSAQSSTADALQLGYALILAATSAPEENTNPEDKEIFEFALNQFFAAQNKEGSWPYSRPLFHYPSVGNAYCFEYEITHSTPPL